jgi:hypothetical protein
MNEDAVAQSPNYVINGAFDIWQRGTSFSFAENAGTYAADRFIGLATSSTPATLTVSQQTFTPGSAPVSGYEGQYFYRQALSTAVTGGVNIIRHRIEDVRTLAGQTATISYWAKGDSSFQGYAAPFIRQNFGSGGSANVDTTFTNHTYTTSWARYTATVSIPSISGKTLGANNHLEIVITLPTSGASTFDLWGVQLEAGSVATPFRRNANSLQGELAACQRYYIRFTGAGNGMLATQGGSTSTTSAVCTIALPVEMRVIPTAIESGGTIALTQFTSTATVTALTLQDRSTNKIGSVTATTAAHTANTFSILRQSSDANSFLAFTAEL